MNCNFCDMFLTMGKKHRRSSSQKFVDEIVLIDDRQLKDAMRHFFYGIKLAVEPAGAATTAALLGPLKEQVRGKKTGIIVCGSNIDIKDFHNLIS